MIYSTVNARALSKNWSVIRDSTLFNALRNEKQRELCEQGDRVKRES